MIFFILLKFIASKSLSVPLKLFSINAKITFLPPLNGKDFTNRKDMTYNLHHAIDNFYSNEFNNSLSN